MSTQMEKAIEILKQNPLLHMDMIEPLRRGHGRVVACEGEGVLMVEENTGTYMLSACAPETAKALLARATDAAFLVVHDEQARETAGTDYGFDGMMAYAQAVYTDTKTFPTPAVADVLAAEVDLTSLSGAISLPSVTAETYDVARSLMTETINRSLGKDWIPYAQAESRDDATIYLFKDLDMEIANGTVYRLFKR